MEVSTCNIVRRFQLLTGLAKGKPQETKTKNRENI